MANRPRFEAGLTGWKRLLAGVGSQVEHSIDDLKYALKQRAGYTGPINVQVYRGYGTQRSVFVSGRVLEDEGLAAPMVGDSPWQNLKRMYKILETDEVPGAVVRVKMAGQTHEVAADREGFFEVTFTGDHFVAGQQEVVCELLQPLGMKGGQPQATVFRGEVFIPRPDAQYVVISDVDDTVMHTQATSLLKAAVHTLLHNAFSRVAFPGVAAFYRALHRGSAGGRRADENLNPFFYLTSNMWSLYDVMQLFFEVNGIPAGPLLMRDLGLSANLLIKGTHEEHKLSRVRELMTLYPDQRFILVGDTGQHDAEIYARVVSELADRSEQERVAAVYLRDVSSGARDAEVRAIVEQVRQLGVACLASDATSRHAQHAVEAGLIEPAAVGDVDEQARRDVVADADTDDVAGR